MVKRLLMAIAVVLTVSFGVGMLSPTPVHAVDCDRGLLNIPGLIPWHYKLEKDPVTCKINPSFYKEADFVKFVWVIVLNVLSLLFAIVGYLTLGFVIYGGYLYVLARGDPAKIAKGKRTVTSALVGLVICILASLIVNTIVTIIIGAIGA